MVELLTSGAMSNRMLLLIFASFFSIFPAMFLIFGIMMRRGQQNNISSYDGEVKGEIIEVLNSEKSAMFATYPIYQYEVNKHKYIVKPNFTFFNSSLDKKYHDSENVTCITYLNKHGGNTRTKYKVGESIIIKSVSYTHLFIEENTSSKPNLKNKPSIMYPRQARSIIA